MIFVGTTPKLNGIDTANIVASLKPVSDELRALADGGGAFVSVFDMDWVAAAAAARPANDTPYAGGDTFRFDDVLQATAPIYFRVRYGHGQTNTPALFIQMGTGFSAVDGSLTGNITVMRTICAPIAANGPFPIWISGGPSFFTLGVIGIVGQAGGTMQIIIERMRDANGVETDEGAVMLCGGGDAVNYRQRIQSCPVAGAVPAAVVTTDHLMSIGGMAGLTSSAIDLVMGPIAVPHNGRWRYITALTYKHTDIAHGAIFDLDHLGEERQYIALGAVLAGLMWGSPSGSTGIVARWE